MRPNNKVNSEITLASIILDYDKKMSDLTKECKANRLKAEKADTAIRVARENINKLKASIRYKATADKFAELKAYQHILSVLK